MRTIFVLLFIATLFTIVFGISMRPSSQDETFSDSEEAKTNPRFIVMFHNYAQSSAHHLQLSQHLQKALNWSEGQEWTFVERSNAAASFDTDFAVIELLPSGKAIDQAIEDLKKSKEFRAIGLDAPIRPRKPAVALRDEQELIPEESDPGLRVDDPSDWMFSNTHYYLGSPWHNESSAAEGRRSTPFSLGLDQPDHSDIVNRRQVLGVIPRYETNIHPAETYNANYFWSQGITGQGVKVAIFDTGLNSYHPNFKNVRERTNWTEEKTNEDTVGHGTFVAGVVAGNDECSGFAPDADLYIFRVFNSRQVSYTSWFLDAFNYAMFTGVEVLNLSIGGPDYMDLPFVEKVHEVTTSGITVISAIGNDGPLYGTLNNPADQSDVIGVGAINTNEEIAYFSSRGMTTWELPHGYGRSKPDIVAHGQNVMGASLTGRCKVLSGTSVASPVVAGAVTLLLSAAKKFQIKNVNPAAVKQILTQSADLVANGNLFEQGAGHMNLMKAFQLLKEYYPRLTIHPSRIDFLECDYMWPYCAQPLYFSGLPIMVNATIINSRNVFKGVRKPVVWIPISNGHHLHVDVQVVEQVTPWTMSLALFISVKKSAFDWEGICEGMVRVSLTSEHNAQGNADEQSAIDSEVDLSVRVQVIPTPNRSKRILWDQFHSLKYPPAYFPRDTLRLKNDPLDWRGDHIHTNFRSVFQYLRNEGFYVEVLGGPYTCFDAKLYSTLLIVDPEDDIKEEEVNKIENDVRHHGLSVSVFAEWFNHDVMKKIVFFDENTRRWWTPIVGGSNIPSLNKILSRFGMEFGTAVLTGDIAVDKYKIPFDSGAPIIRFPEGGVLLRSSLLDEGQHVVTRKSNIFSDAGVLGFFAFNMTHPWQTKEGRIALFGDSSCIDSVDPRNDCFWMLSSILRWTCRGILDDIFHSPKMKLQSNYSHPNYELYSDLSDFSVGNHSNHHNHGSECPTGDS
eukprot:TRINITY_DN6060_c0_g1_i3.p1 TRINITY_DN6060_c0_g1~~TRINITY_DN6060_c0_g1_i3.p1  ORF type:complete len:957 (-),score=176.57 TRINITY_DN6060_c0_g1_i3:105-2975(-)